MLANIIISVGSYSMVTSSPPLSALFTPFLPLTLFLLFFVNCKYINCSVQFYYIKQTQENYKPDKFRSMNLILIFKVFVIKHCFLKKKYIRLLLIQIRSSPTSLNYWLFYVRDHTLIMQHNFSFFGPLLVLFMWKKFIQFATSISLPNNKLFFFKKG